MTSTASSSLFAVVRNVSSLLFPLEHLPSRRQRIQALEVALQHSDDEEEEEEEEDDVLVLVHSIEHPPQQQQQQRQQQQQVRGRHKMKKEDTYLVKVCDKYLIELSLSTDIVGKECLRKVCDKLSIFENDFFGLQHKHKGCLFWVNLRNVLRNQVTPSPDGAYRLYFRVKFHVPPHLIQQDVTRKHFYHDIVRSLRVGLLEIKQSASAMKTLIALIAQIELGNFRQGSIDLLRLYERWTRIMRKAARVDDRLDELSEFNDQELIPKIIATHTTLQGSQPMNAVYRFLEEATRLLDNLGIEYYSATVKDPDTNNRHTVKLGIGNKELFVKMANGQGDFSISYSSIIRLKTSSNNFKIRHLVSIGETDTWTKFRFGSYHLTTAAYRLATEKKIFYGHDQVIDSVTEQHVSSLADMVYTLTRSFLPSESAFGKPRCFVFDIERTLQQFRDDVQRYIYSMNEFDRARVYGFFQSTTNAASQSWSNGVEASSSSEDSQAIVPLGEPVGASNDTSSTMLVASVLTCKICRDQPLDTVFVPCGHMSCQQCADRLESCGVCRTPIETKLRAYLS